jgi:hypothetical protein
VNICPEIPMSHAAASRLARELLNCHALMMRCGASALALLDAADKAPGRLDLRSGYEARRLAGLSARLMGHQTEAVRLLRRLPPAARATLPAAAPALQPESAAKAEAAAPTDLRKLHADPGARRGRLKNGNPCGDFLKAPRCGARTRAGGCCRQPAMVGPGGGRGRCRMHGGLSTGPRTPEGLARCRTVRLVHGCRTRALIGLRSRATHAARRLRGLTRSLALSLSKGRAAAGHGVHRSDSVNRRGVKAQRDRVIPSFAPSRLCGESPPANRTVPAWHGVHRSFRENLRASTFLRWLAARQNRW